MVEYCSILRSLAQNVFFLENLIIFLKNITLDNKEENIVTIFWNSFFKKLNIES
jgi:hypothetical protein